MTSESFRVAMKSKIIHIICLLTLLSGHPVQSNGQPVNMEGQQSVPSNRNPSVIMVLGYNKKTGAHQQATGFFMNQAGDVVTNYHAIAGVDGIKIWTTANEGFPVIKVGSVDIPGDLAILSVDIPSQYVHPAIIASELPTTGEAIEVIGHPLGHQQSSSKGIIASIFPAPKIESIIQFTAPIAIGGSGSPLFNRSGQVVGVASFILYLGVNKEPRYFAIPSSRLLMLKNISSLALHPLL